MADAITIILRCQEAWEYINDLPKLVDEVREDDPLHVKLAWLLGITFDGEIHPMYRSAQKQTKPFVLARVVNDDRANELVADRGATVGSGRLDVALKQDYVEAANEIDDEQALDILQGWNGTVRHYPSFAAVDKIFRHLLRRTEGDMWWIGDRYCETASVLLYRVVDEPERGVEFFLGVDSKGSYAPLGGWSARGVDRSLAETAAREANEETFGYLQDNDLVGPLVELMQSQPGDRRCLIYHEGTKNAMYAVNFDPQFRVDEMLALRQERSCRGNSPPEHFRELHASPPTRFWDECSAWEWVSAEEVFNGDKRMENAIAESVQV
eukprot:TRINITY_DN2961_c0_g1_i1.p1 TRINITY_DN2961_c0_g1~~TRINITY_DN2961_c0_g1_i1.p1  ORF type:complete len:324 (+),score=55.98 TRINITY_DN2961_c0_g1_i1:59-1030(+)